MLGTAPSTQELLASLLSSYHQEQDLEVKFYQVPRVLRVISEFTISSYPRDTDQTEQNHPVGGHTSNADLKCPAYHLYLSAQTPFHWPLRG